MARAAKLEFKKRRMSGFTGNQLKLIACFCMLCDHIGYVLIENGVLYGRNAEYWTLALATDEGQRWYLLARILRTIGRLAFPIFAYMLVEGFIHTKNLRAYMRNMLICALISEVPFDLACFHTAYYPYYQNVCFTLLLGLVSMWLMKKTSKLPGIVTILAGGAVSALAGLIRCDYGAVGVGMISVMWLLRKDESAKLIFGAVIAAIDGLSYYCTAALAFIPLRFYNGKRGTAPLKYFFYLLYPLHLAFFYLLVYLGNR
ncbi:MAG: TraX family protein [Eubacteriales bacterium]|nr:TraX family protein [Eubacteriales bacterium]